MTIMASAPPKSNRTQAEFARAPVALAFLLAFFLIACTPASADTEFGQEGEVVQGNITGGSGVVTGVGGIAINPEGGDIYVAQGFSAWVSKFDSQTNPLFAWGWGVADGSEEMQTCTTTCLQGPLVHDAPTTDALLSPRAIAIDPSSPHHVYVEDESSRRVEAFTDQGQPLFAFGGDVVAYGPDNSANDEIQKLTVSATGGTYKLAFRYPWTQAASDTVPDPETSALPYSATAGEIEAALNDLSTVDGSDVGGGHIAVVETGSREFQFTFQANLGGDDVPQIETRSGSLSGGEAEAGTTHPGGAAEICRMALGDTCKAGGAGSSNGELSSWPDFAPRIAVREGGTIYVGDLNRVQEFDSAGAYIGELPIPGGGNVKALAFANSSEDLFVITESLGVREYDSSGTFLRTLSSEPQGATSITPLTVSVDASGNVYVGEKITTDGELSLEFSGYRPDGTYFAQFTSPLLHHCNDTAFMPGSAIRAQSLYATNAVFCSVGTHDERVHHVVVTALPKPAPALVEGQYVGDVRHNTATLHASVNPKQFDTHYHFEYVDQNSYETEGGFLSPHTERLPAVNGPSNDLGAIDRLDPVAEPISGLQQGTRYHWRVIAESECEPEVHPGRVCVSEGTDETFETLPPVSVRDFTTETVGPEIVELTTELNANGSLTSSRWEICIRPFEGQSDNDCVEGTLPPGEGFQTVTATFSALQPNTKYHYGLTAENEAGRIGAEAPDQTFTTELSTAEEREAEDCPANGTIHGEVQSSLREQTNSLSLSDCRAYEQVSAEDKKGGRVLNGNFVPLAPSGDAAYYESNGDFAGSAFDSLIGIPYFTYRSPSGWVSQAAVAQAAVQSAGGEPSWQGSVGNADLSRWVFTYARGLDGETARQRTLEGHLGMGFADGSYVAQASPTVRFEDGPARPVASAFKLIGYSEDLSTLLIGTESRLLFSDPRPPDTSLGFINVYNYVRLYEVAGADTGSPTLRLVDYVPVGLPVDNENQCLLDFENQLVHYGTRTVSADGSLILYTKPFENVAGAACGEGTANPDGLFLSFKQGPAVQVNLPLPAQCHASSPCATAPARSVMFDGISPDGARAWFTTKEPLVDADTNGSNDLYMAELEAGAVKRLVLVSAADPSAPQPGVSGELGEDGVQDTSSATADQGVIGISSDGSHVAFESPLVLTGNENGLGEGAVEGANNMYVYDANTGALHFVTELCSGPQTSGTNRSPFGGVRGVLDPACAAGGEGQDEDLWGPNRSAGGEADFTPGGRYLLFNSYGRLTPDDTDGVKDAYRYDFAAGELIRVSAGHRGNDGNGNDNQYPVSIGNEGLSIGALGNMGFYGEDSFRSISSDGATVVFTTAAPLVSRDTNTGNSPACDGNGTGCDVYEWEQDGHGSCAEVGGCVSLVSDGRTKHGAQGPVISSSGRDITFASDGGLIPGDGDGVNDVYDARSGGGFPPRPAPGACTPKGTGGSAEACQGEGTKEVIQINPVSEAIEHGTEGERELHCAKGRHKVRRHGQVRCVRNRRHGHRRHRHGRPARLNHGGGK